MSRRWSRPVAKLAAVAAIAFGVVGCAPIPTLQPTKPPLPTLQPTKSPIPPVQPTKPPLPTPLGNITRVSLVDWLRDRPTAVILRGTGSEEHYEVDIADVVAGSWNRIPDVGQIDLDRIASDSQRVGLAGQTQTTLQDHFRFIDSAGQAVDVDASTLSWSPEWRFWGRLVPMPGGGFILTRIESITTIGQDGVVASLALPANFLLQAPTSDPDLFLVGKIGQDNGAEARLPAATGLNLYRHSTGALTHVDASVAQIFPSTKHLAFLLTTDNRWLSLNETGVTEQFGVATSDETSIASDGSRAVYVSANGGVTMIKFPGGESVALGPGPVLSNFTWGATDQVAYWTDDPAVGKKLVILSSDGMSLLAAPK